MYTVEYRRFFLRDLECVVVWPSRLWRYRLIPGILLALLGAYLWEFVNSTAGAIFTGIGLAWVVLELALGPTAGSRVRIMGVSVELPLVKRTRRASKVLAAIDAAVRVSRETTMQPPVSMAEISVQINSETEPAAPSVANGSQSNAI